MDNVLQVFSQNVKRLGKRPCLQFKKDEKWEALSWAEVGERVQRLALGLKALGVKKGDTVALFSSTCVEWTLCDLAILSLGAVTVPIYQSSTSDQVSYILQNSGTKIIFVENNPLCQKVLSEKKNLPGLEKIILISGKVGELAMSFGDLLKMGEESDSKAQENWSKGIDDIHSADTATLVYTSGTTGPPKGAILTHGNFVAEMQACERLFDMTVGDSTLLFLPLAHIFARVMQFFQLWTGFTAAYAENIDKLIDNIGEVKPHFFASVPRIFEKVHERVLHQVESGSPLKKGIFSWAMGVGREISAKRQQKKGIGPVLALQGRLADVLVFGKLKQRLGGRLRFSVSGGAPLPREIGEFFGAAGILILEGYGLTETTAAINCNMLSDYKFGTVGKLVYGAEEKIAADGEILVRGPLIFQGYYKNPEATREAFAEGKWFKTGDIGQIDEDGFLRITDRKKDIIVTAAGKNIAPQNLESLLKTVPMISQVMVHGDRRKYLTALVTLNLDHVKEFARSEAIKYSDLKELARSPKVFSIIKKGIDEKNKTLASYETIKRFAILENDFSQETGELTPTLKVKRKFVTEKYKNILDQLYQES